MENGNGSEYNYKSFQWYCQAGTTEEYHEYCLAEAKVFSLSFLGDKIDRQVKDIGGAAVRTSNTPFFWPDEIIVRFERLAEC